MSNKKGNPKKTAKEKRIMYKVGGEIGQIAGEFITGKDHLLAIAGDAIDSIKSTFQNITGKKKVAVKKRVVTKVKKPVTKLPLTAVKKAATSSAPKKIAPLKKVAKKVVKKAVKKVANKTVGKK